MQNLLRTTAVSAALGLTALLAGSCQRVMLVTSEKISLPYMQDVRAFGATGDGATIDTPAINGK